MRGGDVVAVNALVLGAIPYQEKDKIVRLLTLEFGVVSAFAPAAAVSRKRFGAALEPLGFVKAQLRIPRQDSESGRMYGLQSAEPRESFPELRTASERLEGAVFIARFVLELVPENHADPALFRAVGRGWRALCRVQDVRNETPWIKLAFWAWASHHLGFGDLTSDGELDAFLRGFANMPEPDFEAFAAEISGRQSDRPPVGIEGELYARWSRDTGVHWSYAEDTYRYVPGGPS